LFAAGIVLGVIVLTVFGVSVEIYALSSPEAALTVRRWEFISGFGAFALILSGWGVYLTVDFLREKFKHRQAIAKDQAAKPKF
jgi:hypothetical protein